MEVARYCLIVTRQQHTGSRDLEAGCCCWKLDTVESSLPMPQSA